MTERRNKNKTQSGNNENNRDGKRQKETSQNDPGMRRQKSTSQIIEIEEAQKRRKAKRAEMVKEEKQSKRREKAQEKANRPKMARWKKLAVVGVLVVAALIFVSSGYRIIGLNLDKTAYEQTYEEKQAEKARLEKQLSQVDDPKYVEEQARDRFHMLKDDEIFYVFPGQEPVETQ